MVTLLNEDGRELGTWPLVPRVGEEVLVRGGLRTVLAVTYASQEWVVNAGGFGISQSSHEVSVLLGPVIRPVERLALELRARGWWREGSRFQAGPWSLVLAGDGEWLGMRHADDAAHPDAPPCIYLQGGRPLYRERYLARVATAIANNDLTGPEALALLVTLTDGSRDRDRLGEVVNYSNMADHPAYTRLFERELLERHREGVRVTDKGKAALGLEVP